MARGAWSLLSRRTWVEWAVVTALVAILAAGLTATHGTTRADRLIYDRFMRVQAQSAPDDVVIVAIDEKSLEQIGRWPWPRRVHAQLLERLAQAKPAVIAIDVLMPEASADALVDDDALLAAAIRATGVPVLLPVAMQDIGARHKLAMPVSPLLAAGVRLGHVHVETDDDGIARSVYLTEGFADEPAKPYAHLALAALQAAGRAAHPRDTGSARPQDSDAPYGSVWVRHNLHGIRFLEAEPGIARVSFVDVLNGRADAARLAGKIILIGTTGVGLQDAYPTPVGGNNGLMPGVEIIGTVLSNLQAQSRAQQGIALAPTPVRWVVTAIILMAAMFALLLLPPRAGLALVLALAALLAALTYAAMTYWGWWFPPLALLTALLAALPLWSWRRLEAALSQVASETRLLAAESSPLAPLPAASERSVDVVDARLALLRQAGQRVRDLRRALATALEEWPDAAWIVASDGAVLLANRDAQLLTQRRDVPAGNVYAVLECYSVQLEATQAEYLREAAFSWPLLLRFPLPKVFEEGVEARDAQGRVVLVKTAFLPAGGAGTRALGPAGGMGNDAVIVSVVDLTVIRQLEEQREEALRFLSHDIRSPQASILALLDTDDGKNAPALHERIRSAAQSTLRLADDFVQFARAENVQSYHFEAQDFDSLAQEAADEVWALAQKARVRIVQTPWQEPVWVNADRSLLWRAIVNLLNNAVKFSPSGGEVRIDVRQTATHGRVSIQDQGPGMTEADAARLFSHFSRLPAAQRKEGVGLGLAFVKAVAERHGGKVEVVSALGAGSTFTLEIPLLDASQQKRLT
jgi:CHASE2 domain-containing sensor protein/signal transduction histidine kinase